MLKYLLNNNMYMRSRSCGSHNSQLKVDVIYMKQQALHVFS